MIFRIGLLMTALCAPAFANNWLVTQHVAGGEFVFCQVDCPARTLKIVDLALPAPSPSPVLLKVEPTPVLPELAIQFDLGSARLSKHHTTQIASWAAQVPPGGRLAVMGSTDKIGARNFNRRLADRRARALVQALTAAGMARDRIHLDAQCCIGHPPVDNPTVRRAVARLIKES